MKLRYAAACALACLSIAGPALADGPLTATLDQPVAKRVKFISAHSAWVCEGATCAAGDSVNDSLSPQACAELAKHVGHIAAYSSNSGVLKDDALAKCNANVGGAATTTASR